MYNTLFFFDRRIYVPGKDINLYLATIDHLIRDWKWSGKKSNVDKASTNRTTTMNFCRTMINFRRTQPKTLKQIGF
jgi:hypothetical protein